MIFKQIELDLKKFDDRGNKISNRVQYFEKVAKRLKYHSKIILKLEEKK